jgi:transketolase
MGSILNGAALHGLTRSFVGTFLVFSDYMRPAVRLAALMNIPSTFVWTHDSIGVGEDGPTHQPIEHFAALRAIPNLDVIRPGDANEVSVAWREIISRRSPAAIILSRQNLPVIDRSTHASANEVAKGAYILKAASEKARVTLVATGSEVSLALDVAAALEAKSIPAAVVSAPCLEWFDAQPAAYRASVLPTDSLKVSIEAGISQGWHRYVGSDGLTISLEHYGASASAPVLFKEFGFSVEAIVPQIEAAL